MLSYNKTEKYFLSWIKLFNQLLTALFFHHVITSVTSIHVCPSCHMEVQSASSPAMLSGVILHLGHTTPDASISLFMARFYSVVCFLPQVVKHLLLFPLLLGTFFLLCFVGGFLK